mmetsp:Transcript_9400/g.17948  ORF Transcript_9400/g.17948 Transcript_9400/m.17948 type:complete len:126 (-) Transcript_9400:208-585(-)
MKPDLPTSAAGLAVLISVGALILFSLVLLPLLIVGRKRCAKLCRCCLVKCCKNRASLPPDQVREYLSMEDLLLEVDDGSPPARLATTTTDDDDQGWTAETLVPNILKARIKKRSDSRSDLTTPLL